MPRRFLTTDLRPCSESGGNVPKLCKSSGIILLTVISTTTCLEGAPPAIVLNEQEYFEAPGFAFLVFHNAYSPSRGGFQMMQNGEWLMASDDVVITGLDSGRMPARVTRRVVDRERKTATIIGEAAGLNVGYQMICRTDGDR